MASVLVDITVSLDGYVTDRDPGPGRGLGVDGLVLHDWAIASDDPVDRQVLRDSVAETGALVMGRNLYDVVDSPDGWNEERAYGADERPQRLPPAFVATHHPPERTRLDIFTFVPEGVGRAIELAREAAGDRLVVVMGGGDTCRQALEGGWADELQLHVAPIVMGDGVPLFRTGGPRIEFEQVGVRVSKHATHVRYRVR